MAQRKAAIGSSSSNGNGAKAAADGEEGEKKIAADGTKEGSLAPMQSGYQRDPKTGYFLPGVVQPAPRGSAHMSYRKAIIREIGAGEIVGWIREAARLAQETRSARGLVAVAELAMSYGAGKPGVMREADKGVSLYELLGIAGPDAEADADAIEGSAQPVDD